MNGKIANVSIKEPMWKNLSVGINEVYADYDRVNVNIEYVAKNGVKPFPHNYWISGAELAAKPYMTVGKGVMVRMVRIADLQTEEQYG